MATEKISQERRNLYDFGYGVALLLPFLLLLHAFKEKLGLGFFVLAFIVGLIGLALILAKISCLKPMQNMWIFIFQFGVIAVKVQKGTGVVPMVLIGFAAAILMITIWRVDRLQGLYRRWMRIVRFIGSVVSGLILGLMFYLVFAPVGLLLRLLRKDLLNRKIEPEKESYWIQREYVFDKENYKRQF